MKVMEEDEMSGEHMHKKEENGSFTFQSGQWEELVKETGENS